MQSKNPLIHIRIRLVFAKDTAIATLPLPITEEMLEERLGPILAAAVTNCDPGWDGMYTIPIKEIPSAASGEPLTHFIIHGKLPSMSPILLSTSYKAAECLDITKMVRLGRGHTPPPKAFACAEHMQTCS